MFGIHFSATVPTNYRDWRVTNSELYRKFAWELIARGVMLEPDSREETSRLFKALSGLARGTRNYAGLPHHL